MAVCEMCGRAGSLVNADVEGVMLQVCQGCSKYGQVRRDNSRPFSGGGRGNFRSAAPVVREGVEFRVVVDFAAILRGVRERKKMTQEEFAKFLQEKESIVVNWEHGTVKPFVDTAKRLERVLGVKLIQKEDAVDVGEVVGQKKRTDELTLGDFIKVKKRG